MPVVQESTSFLLGNQWGKTLETWIIISKNTNVLGTEETKATQTLLRDCSLIHKVLQNTIRSALRSVHLCNMKFLCLLSIWVLENRDSRSIYQLTALTEWTNQPRDHFLEKHGCHLPHITRIRILAWWYWSSNFKFYQILLKFSTVHITKICSATYLIK